MTRLDVFHLYRTHEINERELMAYVPRIISLDDAIMLMTEECEND